MSKKLFTPVKIGKLELKNRLVMPGMSVDYCGNDGFITDRAIAFYSARAKGGWGLIVTEYNPVDPGGRSAIGQAGIWDDCFIEGHKKLADAIHSFGGKVMPQIYHAGRQTVPMLNTGNMPVAPSAIPCPMYQVIPRELTIAEIKNIVEKFGDAALRAKKAGYDGVELHCAHGYLINEFFSNYTNKRADEYGGNLYNRTRFAREVLANIKEKCGEDFPVICRISVAEFVTGGLTIEDMKAIAGILEDAGAAAIHCTAGVVGSAIKIIPPAGERHGWLADYALEIKKTVSIPVIVVGRINDPIIADSIITSGKADLVSMGRAALADPDLPNKAACGNYEDIRYCIGCMQGCIGKHEIGLPTSCLVNPAVGKEIDLAVKTAESKKKVFIAGGGVGGCEAAIIAASRGHEVHLYEKSDRLGGQFLLAAVPPNKGEYDCFAVWQKNQLAKLNVDVLLNTELTAEIVENEKPDTVIIATGATPILPRIPGADNAKVVFAKDVLDGKAFVNPNVVIIGGGMVGAETANHLANHGKTVSIVEMASAIAPDEQSSVRVFLMDNLEEKKVQFYTNASVKAITNDGVTIQVAGAEEQCLKADTVVLATGSKPVNCLVDELKSKTDVITIGDASSVRKALDAVEDGYRAALTI